MLKTTLDEILAAQQTIQEKVQPLLESLKDTTIPLEERWAVYTSLVKAHVLVNEEPYGDGYLDVLSQGTGDLTMYDNFNIDRYSSTTFSRMFERIMEAEDEYDKALVKAREANLDTWREHVLKSGFSGFTYDW